MKSELLLGGRSTRGIVRIGNTVRRPLSRDATFGPSCLLHLAHAGFGQAPRYLGIDDAGRAILSFIPGSVPSDLGPYTDAQLAIAAALMRRFHDATASMPVVVENGCEVMCHNDWAPTNTVFVDDRSQAMIDFDTARPGERLWDLGYAAFTWLDLGNDDYVADEQVRRLGIFASAYDWPRCTAPRLAVYALARQTTLAASTRSRNMIGIADWAATCANWTALNLIPLLSSAGYARDV